MDDLLRAVCSWRADKQLRRRGALQRRDCYGRTEDGKAAADGLRGPLLRTPPTSVASDAELSGRTGPRTIGRWTLPTPRFIVAAFGM